MFKTKKFFLVTLGLIIAVLLIFAFLSISSPLSLFANVQNVSDESNSSRILLGDVQITLPKSSDDLGFFAPSESQNFEFEGEILPSLESENFQVTNSIEIIEELPSNSITIQGGGSTQIIDEEEENKDENDVENIGTETGTEMHSAAYDIVFDDLGPDHWSFNFVMKLYNGGVIKGYSDNTFRPNKLINRAELAHVAATAFAEFLEKKSNAKRFTDVRGYDWFAPAIYKLGLSGYSDNTFRPTARANRAEALAMLMTAASFEMTGCPSAGFRDVQEDDWFAPFVDCAVANGIIKGYEVDSEAGVVFEFRPRRKITRAEVAVITSNLLDKKEGG